jgi:hypothetical protein
MISALLSITNCTQTLKKSSFLVLERLQYTNILLHNMEYHDTSSKSKHSPEIQQHELQENHPEVVRAAFCDKPTD